MSEAAAVKSGRRTAARIVSGVLGIALLALTVPFAVGAISDQESIHATHDLAALPLTLFMVTALLATAVRPEQAPSALLGLVGVTAVFIVVDVVAGTLSPFTAFPAVVTGLVWALLGGRILPPRWKPASIQMAGLALIGAIPLAVYAIAQIGLQGGPADDPHVEMGHYAGMALLALTIPVVGLLASLKTAGWRVTVWTAAGALVLFAGGSLLTGQVSSLTTAQSIAAIAGGALFVAIAEREARGAAR